MTTTTDTPQGTSGPELGEELLAGINHLATVTGDLERLEDFYERAFGAGVVRRWDEGQRHSMIRLGSTTVLHAFERHDSPHLSPNQAMFHRGRLDHMGINAASREAFERLRERLVDLGVSDGAITEYPLLSSVSFTDPDGMEAELCWLELDR